jgi:hypothetical protein
VVGRDVVNSQLIGLVVFVLTFGGALLGFFIQFKLPDHHFESNSRDVVKLVIGLVSTLSALVLGLLIASAKNSYDTQQSELDQLSTSLIELNQALVNYGPEADAARIVFRDGFTKTVHRMWPEEKASKIEIRPGGAEMGWINEYFHGILALSPKTDVQHALQGRMIQLSESMRQIRAMMYVQTVTPIAWPFFTILVFWLTILFIGFGCMSKINVTVVASLFVGSMSVAGAIFVIFELNQPYQGMMQVSPKPVFFALGQINEK